MPVPDNGGKGQADLEKRAEREMGKIIADLFGEELKTDETATEIDLNFTLLKLKHRIKRK